MAAPCVLVVFRSMGCFVFYREVYIPLLKTLPHNFTPDSRLRFCLRLPWGIRCP